MKIAILLLIHKYTAQQARLISGLAKDFDLFIHADKKSDIDITSLSGDNIHAYKKYKVYWGSYNQIAATIFLFRQALAKRYDRYVLISGDDIPLKCNAEIKAFFSHTNKEYIEYNSLPRPEWEGECGGFNRIDFFYQDCWMRGQKGAAKRIIYTAIERFNTDIIIPFMRYFKIKRRVNENYFGGANWVNLTHNCLSQAIKYIDSNPEYLKKFKHTRCADEIFLQTIICNHIENIEIENSNLRYVDWTTGPELPRILRESDQPALEETDLLFARKFDSGVDNKIIDKMFLRIGYN